MLMWDEIEEGRQEGRQEGRREDRREQARETAYELHDMGLSADKIARAVKVSLETVQEWFAERTAPTKSTPPL